MFNRQPVVCERCDTPFEQSARGRRAAFCSTACRQAAHRGRHRAAAPAGPEHPNLDRTVEEMVTALQEDVRRLTRTVSAPGNALDALHASAKLARHVECVTAGIVAQARDQRLTWSVIGHALTMGEDTARHRYTPERIARRLRSFLRGPAPGRGLPPGGALPDPAGDPPGRPAGGPAADRLAPVHRTLPGASPCPPTACAAGPRDDARPGIRPPLPRPARARRPGHRVGPARPRRLIDRDVHTLHPPAGGARPAMAGPVTALGRADRTRTASRGSPWPRLKPR
ncbi:hypothetical protein [Streptomyces sp. NBC_01190]|uniref:hypothetical protein n=1 Tax=Streptomyces sp. NBC_01190 TaxID=2903767 RepID=UPI00386AEC12|nr:hypothetical protein OG519_33495 [Streptomyces sp. NBC_01190]